MLGSYLVFQKAPRYGAFFIVFYLLTGSVQAQDCGVIGPLDEKVKVQRIIDGDTVRLTDGRKVRLLGINTPEFNYEGGAHEPLALAARKALSDLIKQANAIGLRYGQQRQDRYKRVLAHLIIDGRVNVQQQLLQRGLAFAIAIPPNLWQQGCYQQAENRARSQSLGIWSQDYYRPLDVGQKLPEQGGFRLLKGRVAHVGRTARSVWLDLAGGVSLRIAREDWHNFPDRDWLQWQGRNIKARGWLSYRQGKWRLRIRHPQNIKKVLSAEK